jgi:hypothetical protein
VLPLAASFLAALYLLGPDLISRSIIGLIAPRRSASANRGEEVSRAVLWAVVPLSLAIVWVIHTPSLRTWGDSATVLNVYACLSTTCSGTDRTNLWPSLRGFLGMNYSLLWREYLLVVVGAIFVCLVIVNFGRLRRRLKHAFLRELLAQIVTPMLADWHVWLSDMLLPEDDLTLVADVLTKNGMLYQGTVGKEVLAADGSLQTLTLISPRRFLRDEHTAAGKPDNTEPFWRQIPGSLFILLASDIVNLNVFYVRKVVEPPKVQPSTEEQDQIQKIRSRLVVTPPGAAPGRPSGYDDGPTE